MQHKMSPGMQNIDNLVEQLLNNEIDENTYQEKSLEDWVDFQIAIAFKDEIIKKEQFKIKDSTGTPVVTLLQ